MQYINRELEPLIKKLINQFPALAITGPRQSGKSTLLKNTFKNYHYLTFDDPLNREQALNDPNFFLDNLPKKVILDEIQYVPQLLSYIKIRIDNNREINGQYIFTGSQQFNMIKNLGDTLAGRIALLDLASFSFSEANKKHNYKSIEKYFLDTSLKGTYPEIVTKPNIDIKTWYSSYLQTYLERDIKSIYNIGNIREFQSFLSLLASRCSQILNLSSFSKELGTSIPTLKNWLSILEASKIIFLLPAFYNNLGKRITKSPKCYFFDSGLICYLTGIKDKDHLFLGPLSGAIFENLVLAETIKFFFNKGLKAPIFYYRSNNQLEVDILIEKSFEELIPIEIKLNKTPKPNMVSNIIKFKKLYPNFKINKGYLIGISEKTIPLMPDIEYVSLINYIKQLDSIYSS